MSNVDELLKKLFSFKRLSVDIFVKLEALREEEESKNTHNFLKTLKKHAEESNFFFDENSDAE